LGFLSSLTTEFFQFFNWYSVVFSFSCKFDSFQKSLRGDRKVECFPDALTALHVSNPNHLSLAAMVRNGFMCRFFLIGRGRIAVAMSSCKLASYFLAVSVTYYCWRSLFFVMELLIDYLLSMIRTKISAGTSPGYLIQTDASNTPYTAHHREWKRSI
jgi:hypothetical protein